jgi:hypothetical protein
MVSSSGGTPKIKVMNRNGTIVPSTLPDASNA